MDRDRPPRSPSGLLRAIDAMRSASGSGAFGVITSNNAGAYRDMWALRSARLGMDYDCFWDFARMKKNAWVQALR